MDHSLTVSTQIPKAITQRLRRTRLYEWLANWREIREWRARQYAAPSPPRIKRACLLRNGTPDSTWIETGTYRGDTTAFIAKSARKVISIEPAPSLWEQASKRFKDVSHVEILNGTSEDVFPELLGHLNGRINFWLDGHFSGGETFEADSHTPVREELDAITRHRDNFDSIVVLIDDIRCFDPEDPTYASYPSLDFLCDWATDNGLKWHIEHDIFVAKSAD